VRKSPLVAGASLRSVVAQLQLAKNSRVAATTKCRVKGFRTRPPKDGLNMDFGQAASKAAQPKANG